jgi:DNA-binding CsgD family transcriptional regulator
MLRHGDLLALLDLLVEVGRRATSPASPSASSRGSRAWSPATPSATTRSRPPDASAEAFIRVALTAREAEVMSCVADGGTNGEIVARLGLSPRTVQRHLENVYRKLEVGTRMAAVARARALADVEGP